MRRTDASSSYSGDDFKALCTLVHELDGLRRSGRWGRLALQVGRRPGAMWRGVRTVRDIRDLELRLTATPAGLAIWEALRPRSSRLARAVLVLPGDRAQYLRGRRRQALRTNVRRAASVGIVCRELHESGEKDAALGQLLSRLGHPDSAEERRYLGNVSGLQTGRQRVFAAIDAVGDVVALAAADIDVRCARLVFLQAVAGPVGGPARYALSLHVIDTLIDAGVGLLLVGGTVRLAPGLQYFQQRLGFEVFNVHPVQEQVESGSRSRFSRTPDGIGRRAAAPQRRA